MTLSTVLFVDIVFLELTANMVFTDGTIVFHARMIEHIPSSYAGKVYAVNELSWCKLYLICK